MAMAILAISIDKASARDPDMLQDVCVADLTSSEVFAFPRGLVHFQQNNGDVPAAVVAGFNSQLPGTQSIATTLFASSPTVPDNVLTKTFQIGTKEVQKIKSRLAPKK
ncbi:hypothetical protein HAX54_028353 [Datura stramonium]|uniref:Germin-like protein n=1 Tax=Datura stramonium TaxID=4076 RepID=A0ABS8V629_DATST|nr:hypothetical protein [Datura stramonium]